MSATKYTQLHRRLLFHWTGPRQDRVIKSREDRTNYLNLLGNILHEGLRFSQPDSSHTEGIEKGVIEVSHPMLCLSEWGVSESNAHSGRYGFMGLGFTRKFVMRAGGRPVVYMPNSKTDPFRKAFIEVIQAAREGSKKDSKIDRNADLLCSYLKTYNFQRTSSRTLPDNEEHKEIKRKRQPSQPDDHHLRLDFGGLFANLEDREWRILSKKPEKQPEHLPFSAGELAMIVFPDHQTLSLAMRHDAIMDWVSKPERPSVCMVSREVIQSI
jgi:hypothetical protein